MLEQMHQTASAAAMQCLHALLCGCKRVNCPCRSQPLHASTAGGHGLDASSHKTMQGWGSTHVNLCPPEAPQDLDAAPALQEALQQPPSHVAQAGWPLLPVHDVQQGTAQAQGHHALLHLLRPCRAVPAAQQSGLARVASEATRTAMQGDSQSQKRKLISGLALTPLHSKQTMRAACP